MPTAVERSNRFQPCRTVSQDYLSQTRPDRTGPDRPGRATGRGRAGPRCPDRAEPSPESQCSSSGSRLISARTGAAAVTGASAGRRRASSTAGPGARPGRDEPPQPAAHARQVRARRWRARIPAIPCATTASNSAIPRSRWPGRPRPRRPVGGPAGAPRADGPAAATSSDRPSRWSRSNARNATGPTRLARQPPRQLRAIGAARARRRRPARHRGSPTVPRPGRRARPAPGVRPTGRRPSASRIRTSPPPARRPARSATSARSPPHHGSNRCSSESNGAGQRARQHRPQVRQIGQLVGLEPQRELVGHRGSMVARSPALDSGASRPRGGSPCRARRAPTTCTACASPTEPRLSPDGRARRRDAPDRRARLRWLPARRSGSSPTDGSDAAAPADARRQARPPSALLPRWADARVHLGPARRSSRRSRTVRPTRDPKDREDVEQVHLLPLDGGEARRLTDLPRGVDAFEWSPDGTRLVVVTTSHGAPRSRRRPPARHRPDADARAAAAVRLPVHRPPRLHAQRRRASPTTRSATCGSSTSRPARRTPADRRPRRPIASRPGRPTAGGSPSRRTAGATRTCCRPAWTSTSSTSRRAW